MTTSFERDIKPLFRPMDKSCMAGFGIDLGDYAWMSDPAGDAEFPDHANSRGVHERLLPDAGAGRMPKNGPYWDEGKITTFEKWMDEGFSP